jgi:hypothetical protein
LIEWFEIQNQVAESLEWFMFYDLEYAKEDSKFRNLYDILYSIKSENP